MKQTMKVNHILLGAMTAALYVLLTLLSNVFGLSSMPVQVRFSEALTIMPVFTGAAIPGLFIGCILSNMLTGGIILDVIFGSLATLVGAVGTRLLRKKPILALLPPILMNSLTVPFILAYAYGIEGSVGFFMFTVFAGEMISAGGLGSLLYFALKPYAGLLFGRGKHDAM